MAGTPGSERTIGQLVADATHDFQGLVRSEIALAKAEVTSGAKDGVKASSRHCSASPGWSAEPSSRCGWPRA